MRTARGHVSGRSPAGARGTVCRPPAEAGLPQDLRHRGQEHGVRQQRQRVLQHLSDEEGHVRTKGCGGRFRSLSEYSVSSFSILQQSRSRVIWYFLQTNKHLHAEQTHFNNKVH